MQFLFAFASYFMALLTILTLLSFANNALALELPNKLQVKNSFVKLATGQKDLNFYFETRVKNPASVSISRIRQPNMFTPKTLNLLEKVYADRIGEELLWSARKLIKRNPSQTLKASGHKSAILYSYEFENNKEKIIVQKLLLATDVDSGWLINFQYPDSNTKGKSHWQQIQSWALNE